eukprot:6491918-Amphidinium_carterae.2
MEFFSPEAFAVYVARFVVLCRSLRRALREALWVCGGRSDVAEVKKLKDYPSFFTRGQHLKGTFWTSPRCKPLGGYRFSIASSKLVWCAHAGDMTTSAASSTMKTKAASSTLLEASWVSDGPKQKRVRSANNTIETQVYRALKDNFPTWGRDRTHGVLRNGKSLAERIESDKRRNASQPGSVSMGPAYYEALRTLHADSRDPSEQLKVKNTTVAVSADCLTAMVAAKSRPANRSLMVSWCKRTETINQTEIVGVLRWFVGLKGHKQDEQHLTELEVVKLMKRLSVDKSFPEEWSIVKEKSEDVMLKLKCGGMGYTEKGSSLVQPAIVELWMRAGMSYTDEYGFKLVDVPLKKSFEVDETRMISKLVRR